MLCGLSNKEKNCALCATGPALMNEENSLSRKIIANYFLVLYKQEESFWGGGLLSTNFLFKSSYLPSFAGDLVAFREREKRNGASMVSQRNEPKHAK